MAGGRLEEEGGVEGVERWAAQDWEREIEELGGGRKEEEERGLGGGGREAGGGGKGEVAGGGREAGWGGGKGEAEAGELRPDFCPPLEGGRGLLVAGEEAGGGPAE